MKNANYNLVKLLHLKMDDVWRLEKFYLEDAEKLGCDKCKELLEEIKKDCDKHVEMLKNELSRHVKEDKLD